MDQEIKKEFEDLTKIIKQSFGELEGKMNEKFDTNQKEHQVIHQKLEDIELRLGNVAYSFEVRELEKRVVNLEKKLGLSEQDI